GVEVGVGTYRPSTVPHVAPAPTRGRAFVPSRSPVVQSSGARSTRSLTNAGRINRNGQASPTTVARPSNEAALSRDHHIFAREAGAQHRDWDRSEEHTSELQSR